jgi:hypothetical protein
MVEVILLCTCKMCQLGYVAKWTHCFPNPQAETHPKPPTLKHIGTPLYYT